MSLRLLLLLLLLAISTGSSYNLQREEPSLDAAAANAPAMEPRVRHKRGIFWDFFQKVVTTKNLIVDQFTDTKNTLNQVYNLINDDFTDAGPPKPTLSPPSTTEGTSLNLGNDDDGEVKTTTEAYRISKFELGRILGRNFRGLKRLMDIEVQDALNQTHYNIREYQAEARKQFSNSLAVDLKNQVKKG